MDDECAVCALCAKHKITNEVQIDFIHKYVEAEAALVDLIGEAEDAGVDLDDPVVTQISDEYFLADDEPSQLH